MFCSSAFSNIASVAIRVTKPLRKPKTTLAMFEKADEQGKLMEAQ